MSTQRSAQQRAAQAIALTLGFYLLAITFAGLLLAIPVYQIAHFHRLFSIHLSTICVIAAGTILWSIWPRTSQPVVSGLRITERSHPRLFDEIKRVAMRLRQTPPHEVYLNLGMNAGVMERGGMFGRNNTRLLTIGLPLLHHLTVSQFRSVLAHEFGHYVGGETKHAVWIYRTREAMGRTTAGLKEGSILQAPFRWYTTTFMRITQSVSREQEFQADFVAAKTYGAETARDSLRSIYEVAPAFDWFWETEFGPLLDENVRAPLLEGFEQFLASPAVQAEVRRLLERRVDRLHVDEFDSHPTFRERLAALARVPATFETSADNRRASALLDNFEQLEESVADAIQMLHGSKKLALVSWAEAANRLLPDQWRKLVRRNGGLLEAHTIESLPELVALKGRFVASVAARIGEQPDSREAEAMARHLIWTGLAVSLLDNGWTCMKAPGSEPEFVRNSQVVQIGPMMEKLENHEMSTAE